jgi:hypothetical protein
VTIPQSPLSALALSNLHSQSEQRSTHFRLDFPTPLKAAASLSAKPTGTSVTTPATRHRHHHLSLVLRSTHCLDEFFIQQPTTGQPGAQLHQRGNQIRVVPFFAIFAAIGTRVASIAHTIATVLVSSHN